MKVVFLIIDSNPCKEIIRETSAILNVDECVVIDNNLYCIAQIIHHFDNSNGYEMTCGLKAINEKSFHLS